MSALDISQSIAYFRDGFVPFSDAKLSIASSPVLYGLSVYTVIGGFWNQKYKKLNIFRLKDHYQRLINSTKIMDFHSFAADWNYEDFESTILELLGLNKIRENVLIRATVFVDEISPGTKIHGLANSLSVYVYPMGELFARDGINVCVSSWQRTGDNAIPSRAKINGSYINASLMKNEALQNGYEDAIALDSHGHVTESTVSNVFMVRDGQIITPDTSTDVLEGVTRDTVIQTAKYLGLPLIERSIDRSELYIADEIFLSGSTARITPVLSVDKRLIGNGIQGPVTVKINKAYEDIQAGNNKAFKAWLSSV
ncbi:MAG: branched-chain amino acid transaminase [Patescibacteria group bacterium]